MSRSYTSSPPCYPWRVAGMINFLFTAEMTFQGNSSTCTVPQLKKPRICPYSRLLLGLWHSNANKNISVT
jgi:hypothetical protein